MSESQRLYRGRIHGRFSGSRRRPRRRGFPFKRVFLVLLIILAGLSYWITRDTHPLYQLIPSQQKYSIVLRDILNSRAKLADSAVWDTLPPDIGSGRITKALRGELSLPEWMVRNIIVDDCYLSGNDLRNFTDVLCVTKMTRIGKLLEQLHWVTPGIERDTAGGLVLRKFDDGSLFYAVRGRILLVSPSRDALVNALTLQQGEALSQEAFEEAFAKAGGEDIGGTATFAKDDPLGEVFQDFRFRLWLDKTQAHLAWNAKLRDEQHDRLAPLLAGVSPRQLLAPPPGLVAASGNLDKPLRDLWLALGPLFAGQGENALFSEAKLIEWETLPEEGPPSVPRLLATILGPLGPGWRVALQGVDLNEWFPAPLFAGTFEVPAGAPAEFLSGLPAAPAPALPWESYPRYDAERAMLRIPMIGGPSLEPVAAAYGDALLVCTSSRIAEDLLASKPVPRPLEQPGNLYVRIQPSECARTIEETLSFLVSEHVLQERALQDYQNVLGGWLYSAERISEVAGLFAYENGEVRGDIVMICSLHP
ncbi:MAG TPA: hypothetical protein PLM14_04125 [Candidatus Hydrogenedentes bacterium]|nr:hypothetical protein [Candidatus Hydrogenedentota bacterium]HQE82163.1 hypothetical protein [Candidatus Hydrogenedentota bacterium]HQH53934.1 hypothetical protein [Candidatus Hydrogenedentota bacterium]HQM48358.1 hypothetical protein [Candidatus Hydrogenedentota bacterium]